MYKINTPYYCIVMTDRSSTSPAHMPLVYLHLICYWVVLWWSLSKIRHLQCLHEKYWVFSYVSNKQGLNCAGTVERPSGTYYWGGTPSRYFILFPFRLEEILRWNSVPLLIEIDLSRTRGSKITELQNIFCNIVGPYPLEFKLTCAGPGG